MTTFALIHGAGSAGSYWHRVTPWLIAAGHVVVAPDLPIANPDAGLIDYADTVERALAEASAPTGDLVVVGQSMGGFSAPVVADRHPDSRLVLVAPMIPVPGETPGQYFAAVDVPAAQRAAAEAGGYDPAFDLHRTFLHDVPPDVVDELMAAGEPEQAEGIFASPFPLAAWPDVPTRVIACTEDRMFPLALVERVARDRLGLPVERLHGGHLPGFAHPRELAELLLAG